MPQATVNRRNTIAEPISITDEQEAGPSGAKRMTTKDEDILLAEILKHFDTIENKTTDRSLTPKVVQAKNAEAWKAIKAAFCEKTGVSCIASVVGV